MIVAKIDTVPWDPANGLDDPGAELDYLTAAMEDGDPRVIAAAIGDIARARGATDVAKSAGISREALYKAFAEQGNPTLSTLLAVLKVLDIRLMPASTKGAIPAAGT